MMLLILQVVIICFIVLISVCMVVIVRAGLRVEMYIRKIMETVLVMQLIQSELNEHLEEIRKEIYGIGPSYAIMAKKAREQGGKT